MMKLDRTLNKAKSHAKKGEFEEAFLLYKNVLEVFPQNKQALRELRTLQAKRLIHSGSSLSQTDIDSVRTLYSQGKIKEALVFIDSLIKEYPDESVLYNISGVCYADLGHADMAIKNYKHALTIQSDYSEAHYNLGNILTDHGQLEGAISCYKQAIETNPEIPEIHNNLGITFNKLSKYNCAIKSYKTAVSIKPNYPEAYFNLGNAFKELRKFDLAIINYKHALKIKPSYAEAYYCLGNAFMDLDQLENALKSYEQALKIRPNYAEIYFCFGNIFRSLGQFKNAVKNYEKALEINSNYFEAYNNLGIVLKELGQFQTAIYQYKQALAINPNYVEACYNLGNIFKDIGHSNDAVTCYKQALNLDHNIAEVHNNLALVLRDLGRLDESVKYHEHALILKPDYVAAHSNFGATLKDLGRLNEAFRSYEQALIIDPEYADARWNLSLVQLLIGNFKRGWENYEWRWKIKGHDPERHYPQAKWEGQLLKGKTLLIYTEQGIGDEVMFCSCLPDLISQEPKLIILECDHRFKPLLERSFPGVDIVIKQALETPNDFKEFHFIDFQVAIGTLPRFLRSDFKFFPTQYSFLKADPVLVNKWRDRFSELGTGLNIGISWRGGRIESTIKSRSTPLSQWESVLKSNANFINLQYGDCVEAINQTEERMGVRIHDWEDADPLKDLENFAAQIAALDLVISIDNSTVHFAGALGVPVWTLLPFAPDWRWFLNRDDSLWYPSVRLFRQKNLDDWENVFEEVINALKLHNRQIQITADLTALLTATIKAFRIGAIPEGHNKLMTLLELLASQTTTLSEEKVLKLKMLLNKVLKELKQKNYGAITEILEQEIAVLLDLSVLV